MAVFDIETDGLNPTKIHVLSWVDNNGDVHHTFDYELMRIFFQNAEVLIGHNIIRYDIPVVERLLDIKIKAKVIDTLAISWYLNHNRPKHGLESYGEDYGIPKPKIEDWANLTPKEYAHRCDEDVKINKRLYTDLMFKMNKLYPTESERDRFIDYLMFKLDCARAQEALQWKLDVDRAKGYLAEWEMLRAEKTEQLADAMPPLKKYSMRVRPKVYTKQDGTLSAKGEAWEALCKEHKVPTTTVNLKVEVGEERANPNSSDQVKDWLYSLGWKPKTFKFVRNSDGSERKIEQIRKDGELCPSVKSLSDQDSAILVLDGLSVLSHRIGVIKAMVDCEEGGYVKATVAGLTNTLRFKHAKPLVNLPSVDRPYGSEIRGCLIAPDNYSLCGADMTSLEDTTKRHYMMPLDPDYVKEMSQEGFDPHLDLAKHAGVITQKDIDRHNSGEVSLKALRKNYKVVNYSATYGVGVSKLARETGMTHNEAKSLLEAFWHRNWSVQAVATSLKTRELFGGMWVQNPVSKFWHSLRSEKDRFSTLNQSTGVYCFDNWVKRCREHGIPVIGQFHDEIIALVPKGKEITVKMNMKRAISDLNNELKLNVPLGIDAQIGNSYADIH